MSKRASGNGCSQGISNAGVSRAPGSSLGAPSPDGNGRRARPPAPKGTRWSRSGTTRSVPTRACGRTGRGPSTPAASSPAPGPRPRGTNPASVALRHQLTWVRLEVHGHIIVYTAARHSPRRGSAGRSRLGDFERRPKRGVSEPAEIEIPPSGRSQAGSADPMTARSQGRRSRSATFLRSHEPERRAWNVAKAASHQPGERLWSAHQ
jgi:hypothetical protein